MRYKKEDYQKKGMVVINWMIRPSTKLESRYSEPLAEQIAVMVDFKVAMNHGYITFGKYRPKRSIRRALLYSKSFRLQ